jgi:hypothetical protein
MKCKKNIRNLVYLNVKISTNIRERSHLYELFKNKDWVTIEGGKDRINYMQYINNIHSHKFILSPPGNGIDCHRTWEVLYLGSIPIVKKSICMDFFKDLPIIFVDDYRQITPEFLEKENIKNKDKKLDMLSFNYWKKKIYRYAEREQ